MADETAEQLIEEYNQRLAAERSLRQLWTKSEKGDLPGHPFRGNQWSGGQSSKGDKYSEISGMNEFLDLSRNALDENRRFLESIPTPSHLEWNPNDPEDSPSEEFFNWLAERDAPLSQGQAAVKEQIRLSNELNTPLRQGDPLSPKMKQRIQKLDALFELPGNRAPKPLIVYRSFTPEQNKILEKDGNLVDAGFPSVGYSKGAAEHFGSSTVRKLLIPKGTRLVFGSANEDELILDRNTKFQLMEDGSVLVSQNKSRKFIFAWLKHLTGQHNQADHARGGGSVLQSHVSELISHLETIFKGPGRAAAVNEVLSASKFPEYLKGILQETPGVDEIKAVVDWSVRRGRIWEAA